MPPGQTKISAYRAMATTAKEQLSTPQYLCALWARNNLSYDLIDDPMFRHQFGVCIPIGFNRMKLSEEMHSLAELINKPHKLPTNVHACLTAGYVPCGSVAGAWDKGNKKFLSWGGSNN